MQANLYVSEKLMLARLQELHRQEQSQLPDREARRKERAQRSARVAQRLAGMLASLLP